MNQLQHATPHPVKPDPRATALTQIALILRLAVIAAAIAVSLWLVGEVLLVVFAAALVAVGLHGSARLIMRLTRLRYGYALALLVLGGIAIIGAVGWWTGPRIATEATQLRSELGRQAGQLRDQLGHTQLGQILLRQLPTALGGEKQEQPGSSFVPGVAGSVAGFISSAFGALGTIAVVLISGLYFAMSPGTYTRGALRLLPPRHRIGGWRVASHVGDQLWHWLAGQAVDMLFVGILSGGGLALLGVPLSLVLGLLAGLLNFVPYIGAIVGAIPAILIAFSQGPQQAAFVAALYAVVQGLEGNLLAPIIQRSAAHLPPAVTILSQTAFGALFGVPGLILATPLTAALLAVGQEMTEPDE